MKNRSILHAADVKYRCERRAAGRLPERSLMSNQLEDYILTIPNFPKEGIMFRDVTTIMQSPEGMKLAIDGILNALEGVDYDAVAGLEARGFIFGAPVAVAAGKGFVPVRKKGKLPRETVSASYELEYGSAELEMHRDSIRPGEKVVLIDDLLATGGSLECAARLIRELGGQVVRIVVLIELEGLKGREKLQGCDVVSLIKYPGI